MKERNLLRNRKYHSVSFADINGMQRLKKKVPAKAVREADSENVPPDPNSFYNFAVSNFTAGTAPFYTRTDNVKHSVLVSTPPAERNVTSILVFSTIR